MGRTKWYIIYLQITGSYSFLGNLGWQIFASTVFEDTWHVEILDGVREVTGGIEADIICLETPAEDISHDSRLILLLLYLVGLLLHVSILHISCSLRQVRPRIQLLWGTDWRSFLVCDACDFFDMTNLCDIASLSVTHICFIARGLFITSVPCNGDLQVVTDWLIWESAVILLVTARQIIVNWVDTCSMVLRASHWFDIGTSKLFAWINAFLLRRLLLLILLSLESTVFPIFRSYELTLILIHLSNRLHRILQRLQLLLVVFTIAVYSILLPKYILLGKLIAQHIGRGVQGVAFPTATLAAYCGAEKFSGHLKCKVGFLLFFNWLLLLLLVFVAATTILLFDVWLCDQLLSCHTHSWAFRSNRLV